MNGLMQTTRTSTAPATMPPKDEETLIPASPAHPLTRTLSTPGRDRALEDRMAHLRQMGAEMLRTVELERAATLTRLGQRALMVLGLAAALLLPARAARAGAAEVVIDSTHVMGQAHRGQMFVRPRAIAIDPTHGEVIVANSGLGRIEYFDYRTWPLGFFTHEVPGPDGRPLVGEPLALAVTAQGELLLSDFRAPYVDVLDYRGRSLRTIVLPAPDDTAGAQAGPGQIAVAPDGHILIASRGAGRVHVFDDRMRFVTTWGVTGQDSAQLKDITALAVAADGRVFVTCAATTYAVQVFDMDGRFERGFGRHELGPGNFSLPSGLAFASGDRVCVSDAIRQIVQVFETDGTFVGTFGGVGIGLAQFREPSALAGDGHGLLALAEKSGSRFQVLWLR